MRDIRHPDSKSYEGEDNKHEKSNKHLKDLFKIKAF